MNLRGGLAIIRVQLFGFLSAWGFFWTLALGWMTGPLIYLLVWSTAASGGAIGGYERNDFILYFLSLIVVNQFTYPTSHWSTGQAINNGSISSAFLRPLPLFYGDMGCDAAVKIVCMPFVIVVVTILGFLFGVYPTFSFSALPMAIAALLMALTIRFLLAHTLALASFWTQQSDSLLSVNDTFVFLFSGQVAPLALFPPALKSITAFLPYRYMAAFPVEVLMGTLTKAQAVNGLVIQAIWSVVLALICIMVTKRGRKRYTATGG